MNKYLILCVDDEREVLDSVIQDLDCFEEHFILEPAESVKEAKELILESHNEGVKLALILCDHIMPDQTGIQFLIELNEQPSTQATRKLLLTGQAGLEDTVEAINHSSLDFYIAKPWRGDELRKVVKDQLTTYMIANETNLMPWASALDTERVFDAMAKNRLEFGE
jgi:response regulator RpfG family c-di-GMP phosphodiesterase